MFGLRRREKKVANNSVKSLSRRWKPVLEVLEDRLTPASFYLPTNQFLTNPTGLLTGATYGNHLDIALSYLRSHASDLGLTAQDVASPIVTSQYTDSNTGFTHIYLRQQVNGLEVANANLGVSLTANGSIIGLGESFVNNVAYLTGVGSTNTIDAFQAVTFAANSLGLNSDNISVLSEPTGVAQTTILRASGVSLDNITARLHYVPISQNSVTLAWNLVFRTPNGDNWYDVSVSANGNGGVNTGGVVYLSDWGGDHASYNAIPLPNESPSDGGFSIQNNPENTTASPFGWHDTNGVAGAEFTDTRGNNVFAHLDRNDNNVPDADEGGGARPDGGAALNFSGFTFDPTTAPTTTQNQNIAQVNLFYMNNIAHDILYQYGFTEAAGNFQFNNYGKGGVGGDGVQADAQDGGGFNNANFFTPPDGTSPRMQMYLWDKTNPNRDGDLDNSIIIHEYGHGVSNRLTGGPANSNALNALQSGGMGEGWSDFYAGVFLQRTADTQNGSYTIASYSNTVGIRRFPYSWNTNTNPLTFDAYGTSGTSYNGITRTVAVHRSGELWNSALWDLNWLLINKYGYDSDLYTGWTAAAGPGHAGNKLVQRLVMDAMKLQPANPSFLDARNAIIAADIALNGGADVGEIWTAFARRGLGVNASTASANSTSMTVDYSAPNFNLSGGVLTISGDQDFANQNDAIRLVRDPNNPGDLLVFVNSPAANPNFPDFRVDLALVTQINVNGLGGNDSLTIDETNGVVNEPIAFDGGSPAFPTIGGDSLFVMGNSFANLVYNATGIGAGNINLDGNLITFTSLEPVTVTSALGNVTINLTDAAVHTSTLSDDAVAGNNLSLVSIDGGIESLTFTNPTGFLAFNGNNNSNTIILNALDTASLTPRIDLNGGTNNDEIRVNVLRAGQTANIFGNNGGNVAVIGGSTAATFNTGIGQLANVLGTVNVLFNSASNVLIDDSGFAAGRVYTSDHIAVVPQFGGAGTTLTASGLSTVVNVVNGANQVQTASGAGNDTFRINTTLVAAYSGTTSQVFFGNNGNDNFFVRPSTTAGIFVFGGAPAVGDPNVPPDGDRLVVFAYGATVNPLFSSDGTVNAPGLQPVFFNNIEFVSVPDRFEINDTPSQATFLGSDPFVTLRDLSIHSVDDPSTAAVNESDIDYFRYTAHDTGYLVINAQYLSVLGGQFVVEVYRPTSLANLVGPNVPAAPFNNLANYVTSTAGAVGTLDGTRLVVPVVAQQVYYIRVRGLNQQLDAGNYNLELENFKAPVPTVVDMATASDSGRSNTDNITNINAPTFTIQADLSAFALEGISVLTGAQALAGITPGAGVQVFIQPNGGGPVITAFADPVAGSDNTLFTITTPVLPDGIHGITASVVVFDQNSPNGLAGDVKRSGRSLVGSPPLYFTIDTVAPQPPSLFLNPPDDSGVVGQPNTFVDNITKYPAANFTGNAEANAWVQWFAVENLSGFNIPQSGGTAVSNAFGQYFIDPTFELNNPTFFSLDGERLVFATATDVAGNQSTEQNLTMFLDTRGPQVLDVLAFDADGNPVSLVGTKNAPLSIAFIDVLFIDQPARTDNFLYTAVNELLAETVGNYAMVGKRTGPAKINSAELIDVTVAGDIGQATVRLTFASPLADDTFQFTIFDRVMDDVGNRLDGDFFVLPNNGSPLPSGDGVPGDNFDTFFFTVDARPELGFYANGTVNLDLNGDFIVNPQPVVGQDAVLPYGPNGSAVFAGQFSPAGAAAVSGFDRLGSYGLVNRKYHFFLDFTDDGDFNDAGEKILSGLQINGTPIAGNWDDSKAGDEVGLFTGKIWYLDTNGSNSIDAGDTKLTGNMRGLPVAGDFDGDGLDDLATYQNGTYYFDFAADGLTGNTQYSFRTIGFPGVNGVASKLARPVASDFDRDGIDDLGLFFPNMTTSPKNQAVWMFLVSNDADGLIRTVGEANTLNHGFKSNQFPGGSLDFSATYGSNKALPVVGNFDPPVKAAQAQQITTQASHQTKIAALAKELADLYFVSNVDPFTGKPKT